MATLLGPSTAPPAGAAPETAGAGYDRQDPQPSQPPSPPPPAPPLPQQQQQQQGQQQQQQQQEEEGASSSATGAEAAAAEQLLLLCRGTGPGPELAEPRSPSTGSRDTLLDQPGPVGSAEASVKQRWRKVKASGLRSPWLHVLSLRALPLARERHSVRRWARAASPSGRPLAHIQIVAQPRVPCTADPNRRRPPHPPPPPAVLPQRLLLSLAERRAQASGSQQPELQPGLHQQQPPALPLPEGPAAWQPTVAAQGARQAVLLSRGGPTVELASLSATDTAAAAHGWIAYRQQQQQQRRQQPAQPLVLGHADFGSSLRQYVASGYAAGYAAAQPGIQLQRALSWGPSVSLPASTGWDQPGWQQPGQTWVHPLPYSQHQASS